MKKVLGGKEKVRVAVAQASSVFMDREKTVEKACRMIREAAAGGAELVAFPEAFIPGYPAYYTVGYETGAHEWTDFMIALQDNSIVIPGPETETLAETAREAGVHVVMGCNELDGRKGSRTVYNSLLFVSREKGVLGRHRKLMPTYTERIYWGRGDGSDLVAYDTDIGRISGLICWENHMVLVRAAMVYSGADFHAAVWPGNWKRGTDKLLDPDTENLGTGCNLQPLVRVHAFEAGAFVLSACGCLGPEDFPERWHYVRDGDHVNYEWAAGGSSIVNPAGRYLAEPCFEKDAILYADCYANQIKAVKAVFDSLGHYSRWDVARLLLNKEGQEPVKTRDGGLPELSPEDARRISQEHEISEEKLFALVEEIAGVFGGD